MLNILQDIVLQFLKPNLHTPWNSPCWLAVLFQPTDAIHDWKIKMNPSNTISKNWGVALLAALTIVVANNASAQNSAPPPASPGVQVLDLAGTPIAADNVVTPYSLSFEATSTTSFVTFLFRHDPGFFTLTNASVADSSTPTTNLLLNGDFTVGAPTVSGGGAPDWTYFQQTGVTFLGHELAPATPGWYDGATQGYDGIDQMFSTTIGDTYNVTFDLAQWNQNGVIPPGDLYQDTSTNNNNVVSGGTEGDGIDALVYAGDAIPTSSVPDESSTFMLLLGVLGLVIIMKRRSFARATR